MLFKYSELIFKSTSSFNYILFNHQICVQIIQRVSEPHVVSLAGQSMELVASESVTIIETLIEEANKGEIDLEGLDTFWSYKTKVVT